MTPSPLKEDFLHFLWRTKKIPPRLQTTDGREIEIVEFGNYNADAGPDFFNAKVRIGGTLWAGNVEMHVFTSDWSRHRHQHDNAYDNVILHVVYEADQKTGSGADIPVLELKGKIPRHYLDHYLTLMQATAPVPCHRLISGVPKSKIGFWKYSLTAERLQAKSVLVQQILDSTGFNWEETLYIMLARYFGARVNTEPFERLARKIPLNLVLKNKDKPLVLEALCFGQAGMLNASYQDEHYTLLRQEYEYLRKKYDLSPMDPVAWKFARMRPVNFPTIRIAQFSDLMHRMDFLFRSISEAHGPKDVRKLLACRAGAYWDDRYRFDTPSKEYEKSPGASFTDLLIINAVAPVLFHYGTVYNEEKFHNKAIGLLEDTKAEENSIIRHWKELGLEVNSAFDSQSLIQLRQNYCSSHACMNCRIGNEIMNANNDGQKILA